MTALPAMDPVVARVAEGWFGVEFPDPLPAPVGLIVGEQPGPRSNPRLPMWPWPPRSAGGRLHAMSGLDPLAYLSRLARTNLQPEAGRWHRANAADHALSIYRMFRSGPARARWPRLVLCGRRVAEAFTLADAPYYEPVHRAGMSYAVIPHPSERNPIYNDPDARLNAGTAVRWAARIDEVKPS